MSVREWDDDQTEYRVVTNHEEQYSIWPLSKELPLGWTEPEGAPRGKKPEVLAYIERVWTDMRPKSLREKMDRSMNEPPSGA